MGVNQICNASYTEIQKEGTSKNVSIEDKMLHQLKMINKKIKTALNIKNRTIIHVELKTHQNVERDLAGSFVVFFFPFVYIHYMNPSISVYMLT